MAPHPDCAGCYLEDLGAGFVTADAVTPQTKLAIFGESPGKDEIAHRPPRGYVGASGRLLRRQARTAGLTLWSAWPNDPKPPFEEAAMFNVTQCRPPENQFAGYVVAQQCLERHGQERKAAGLPWLATGANAIEALTGYRVDALTTRGSILPAKSGGWVTATFHPAYLLYGKDDEQDGKAMDQLEPLLAMDVKRAIVTKQPYVPVVKLDWTGELALAEWERAKPTGVVAVDIEGGGGAPNVLGIGWERGTAWTMPWTAAAKRLVTRAFAESVPLFHNAEYDIPEICATGVPEPRRWADSINTAALVNPEFRKGLQPQVLTWVLGTLAWKGLVPHQGPVIDKHMLWRALWTEVLTRLGRGVPQSDAEWMFFYNGLDVAWDLDLFRNHQQILTSQGRFTYYQTVSEPIQEPLLSMGRRGIPADPERFAYHRTACERLVRMALRILRPACAAMLRERIAPVAEQVAQLEAARELERLGGVRKFSRGEELASLRGKLRTLEAAVEKGFNFDSYPQRKAMLYEWYGLPEVRKGKKGKSHVTTDDDAVESLIARMTKTDPFDESGKMTKPLRPKRGTVEECVYVLKAMAAGKKWRTWASGFCRPEWETPAGRRPRVTTYYSQATAFTGRLSSGAETSDPEKSDITTRKIAHLQNVPRKIRDAFVADPGYVMVGADWSGLQWAICMWYAAAYDTDGFHLDLLNRHQAGELDPHRFLAAAVFECAESEVRSEQRRIAKAYTFGRMFLGSERGLAREAGHRDSVGIRVCGVHDRTYLLGEWQKAVLAMAKQRGFLQTPLGWRMTFPSWNIDKGVALAGIIQATEADLTKWTLARLWRACPPRWEILSSTHDSFLMQVPKTEAVEGKAWLLGQMQQPIPWLGGRTWRAEGKVGPNWRAVS